MYKDQMTPVERAPAIAEGKDVDRMPIGIMFGAPAHSLLGWTVQQEWESGRSLAEVQKKFIRLSIPMVWEQAMGCTAWVCSMARRPICPSISRCR